MNKTTNYQLNQWEPEDQVRRTDFNEDNAKLDAALTGLQTALAGKAANSTISALQTVVNSKGNCRIEVGSYVGDGDDYGIVSITTSFPPKLLVVMNNTLGVAVQPQGVIRFISSLARTSSITWRDDGASWQRGSSNMTSGDFLNSANTIYYYVVLG